MSRLELCSYGLSDSDNSSASLGVSLNLGAAGGVGVTAGISRGNGNADGHDVTWTESTIQGGNQPGDQVTLNSGTNANLIGAQVSGNQVIANVGTSGQGNLNIQSLQDSSNYNSEQESAGVSVTVPISGTNWGGSISASNTEINSNYQSVNEQAGIFAGDEGFQVKVNGNTNMKGAVIASTEQAIQNNANSLTTQTLTTTNIENSAAYQGEAYSATVGGGLQAGLPQLSGAGIGEDRGDASSATVSAISGGTVTITDNAQQTALRGTDANTSAALLNRDVYVNEQGQAVNSQGDTIANTIAPIFDAEQVQKEIDAQLRITQAFSQQAPAALNTFAQSQMQPYLEANKTLEESRAQLELTEDPLEQEQLQTLIIEAEQILRETQVDYDNWREGGDYRVASNIIIATISGGAQGAIGAVTQESLSWAADVMRQAMIEDSMKFPGICINGTSDCISNMSGDSVGVNGDGKKVAGGRIVLEYWCADGRCEPDSSTRSGYKENADGTVIFNPGTDENGKTLTINQFIEQNPRLISPLGGHQGEQGQMDLLGIQFDYAAGSFWDKLAEAYSGTHDTFNSFIWYDELGNGKKLDGTLIGKVGDITNITNVPLATPFALSVLLPPEVWNAVLTSIKSIK